MHRFFYFLLVVVLIQSCNSKYYLRSHSYAENPKLRIFDEYLLQRNRIINVNDKKLSANSLVCEDSVLLFSNNYKLDKDLKSEIYYDLQSMIKQKPNKSFLFLKPFLWIHNLTDTLRVKYVYDKNYQWSDDSGAVYMGGIRPDTLNIKKRIGDSIVYRKSKFRKFLMKKVGEAPVVFLKKYANSTSKSMQNYLIQKGFLHAKTGFQIKYKEHKVYVDYFYSTGSPLLIDSVFYNATDSNINNIILKERINSALQTGALMDKNSFNTERTRIASLMKNKGYYFFNWNTIGFVADTVNAQKYLPNFPYSLGNQGETRVNIYVQINTDNDTLSNRVYTMKNVYIVLDDANQELHKAMRKFDKDSTHISFKSSSLNKKNKIGLTRVSIDQNDSLFSWKFYNKNLLSGINQEPDFNNKQLLVVDGSRYAYLARIKNTDRTDKTISNIKYNENGFSFISYLPTSKGFLDVPTKAEMILQDTSRSIALLQIRPYGKSFSKAYYKTLSLIPDSEIPVQTLLRKPLKNFESKIITDKKLIKKTLRDNLVIKNGVISDIIPLHAGDQYNFDRAKETINKISELELFRFPRIEYVVNRQDPNKLDAFVYMQQAKKQSFGAETDVNSSNANLGWALNLSYKNKNIFKGGETFLFNIEGGINFNFKPDTTQNTKGIVRWINLLDVNASLNIFFPKIIGFRNWSLSVDAPKTKMVISYHYLQQSTDFRVSSFDAVFGYDWSIRKKKHIFNYTPFLLNFTLEPVLDASFEQRLRDNNFALWNSLKERYFIPGSSFSYLFSPVKTKKIQFTLKTLFEASGNSTWIIDQILNTDIALFGTKYSQYFKADLDIRLTYEPFKNHEIVSRIMFGAAIPFGESSRVPYSRQFFLGGPSSMRGWNMRELGPGKLRPISGALFQLGDIRFETNLEYRFKFNSWIGGAFFADAGNIWLAKSVLYQETFLNQPYETGAFNSRFLEELAVDVGFGLRLDFTFFVFRFDVAFPVRNPSGFAIIDTNGLTQYVDGAGNQQFWKFDYSNANFLLAVGYPF
jgi:hypothetical protein